MSSGPRESSFAAVTTAVVSSSSRSTSSVAWSMGTLARRDAGVLELHQLEDVTRAIPLLPGDRDQATRHPHRRPGGAGVVHGEGAEAGARPAGCNRLREVGDPGVPGRDHV